MQINMTISTTHHARIGKPDQPVHLMRIVQRRSLEAVLGQAMKAMVNHEEPLYFDILNPTDEPVLVMIAGAPAFPLTLPRPAPYYHYRFDNICDGDLYMLRQVLGELASYLNINLEEHSSSRAWLALQQAREVATA